MSDNFILDTLGLTPKTPGQTTESSPLQVIDQRLAEDKARDDSKGLIAKAIDSILKLAWHADDQTRKELIDLRVRVQAADEHHDVQALSTLTPQIKAAIDADKAAVASESTRDKVSDFVSGIITTTPLFMKGRRARALSIGINAINDIHTNDGALGMTEDAVMGGAKGYALSVTFEHVRKTKASAAAQGTGLGLATRIEEGLLTRQNYRSDTGKFTIGTGLSNTASTVFNPYSLLVDAGTFGTVSKVSKLFPNNPVAANLIVGSTVGIVSGANSEIQRESQTGHYSATEILSKSLWGGASSMVSASLGGRLEKTSLLNPRIPVANIVPESPLPDQAAHPAQIEEPSEHQPNPTRSPGQFDLLPDWSVGVDSVEFVKTMQKLIPATRNEAALQMLDAISHPDYENQLVEARQRIQATFSSEGRLLDFLEHKHDIDNPEAMKKVIDGDAESQRAYDDYLELAKPKNDFLREIEPVRKALEDGLNRVNADNNVPPVRLKVSFSLDKRTAGVYRDGEIEISAKDFAGGRSSKEIMDTLRHEDEHLVHDALVVAGTIDRIAGQDPIDAHMKEIKSALALLDATSNEDFIRSVDQLRQNKGPNGTRLPLSEDEKARFEAICKSFSDQSDFQDKAIDLRVVDGMLEEIERGDVAKALDELALLGTSTRYDELSSQEMRDSLIPKTLRQTVDPETLSKWPKFEDQLPLPSDPEVLGQILNELREIGLAEKAKLETELGSERDRHETYLGWTHEREARDAAGELTTAQLLVDYLSRRETYDGLQGVKPDPHVAKSAILHALSSGEVSNAIGQYADFAAYGDVTFGEAPQVIRNLVGEEAAGDWPYLMKDLPILPQGNERAARVAEFERFLNDEAQWLQ